MQQTHTSIDKQNCDINIPNPFTKRLFSKRPQLISKQIQTQTFQNTHKNQHQILSIFQDDQQIIDNNKLFQRITQQIQQIKQSINQRIRINKLRKNDPNHIPKQNQKAQLIIANMKSYFQQLLCIQPTDSNHSSPKIIETTICYQQQVCDFAKNQEQKQVPQQSHPNQIQNTKFTVKYNNIENNHMNNGNVSYFKKINNERDSARRITNQKLDRTDQNIKHDESKGKKLPHQHNANMKSNIIEQGNKKNNSSVYELILNEQKNKLKKNQANKN